MKILAFESSAKAASTALLSDGLLLAEYTQNSGQTHSRTLMQMAKDMLTSCDLTPQDIGAVAVAAGPGSFTGVRIGMACAKGFAWGRQAAALRRVHARGDDARRGLRRWSLLRLHGRAEAADLQRGILSAGREAYPPDGRPCDRHRRARAGAFRAGPAPSTCSATARSSSLTRWQAAACRSSCFPSSCGSSGRAALALCAMDRMLAGDPGDAAALTPNYLRMAQAERTRQNNQDFYLKK